MKMLLFFEESVDWLNEKIGLAMAWLCTGLVLLICYDVGARYLFNVSSVAMYELEWHIFSLVFLLGSAYTLKHDKHVRVDVFYTRFSLKKKAWVDLLGTVFFLIPFCVVMIRACIPYVRNSFIINEVSSDPGGLTHRYLIKGAIVVGFALLLLQGISYMIRSIAVISGYNKK